MAFAPMDPRLEQRLREEVIYLHSLWHRGPRTLAPSKTTLFKRGGDERDKKMGKDTANTSTPAATEWPCPTPTPPPSDQGWLTPNLEAKTKAAADAVLSPEDQLKLASRNAHRIAQKVVNEFFSSDATDSDSDSDDELIADDGHGCERDYYSFFFKVLDENPELRACYKNFVDGEFTCLVCGALGGKRMSKKYRGCMALVQHSIAKAKAKKRRAHRALGQAICKILDWDIDQLASIASSLSFMSCEGKVNLSAAKVAVAVDNVDPVKAEGDGLDSKDGGIIVVDSVASVEDKLVSADNENGAGVLPSGDKVNVNSSNCADAGPSSLCGDPASEELTSVS